MMEEVRSRSICSGKGSQPLGYGQLLGHSPLGTGPLKQCVSKQSFIWSCTIFRLCTWNHSPPTAKLLKPPLQIHRTKKTGGWGKNSHGNGQIQVRTTTTVEEQTFSVCPVTSVFSFFQPLFLKQNRFLSCRMWQASLQEVNFSSPSTGKKASCPISHHLTLRNYLQRLSWTFFQMIQILTQAMLLKWMHIPIAAILA